MPSSYFKFKQFTIHQDKTAMRVGTDGVMLGAWADVSNAKTVLDIGTGTGVIALMIAQRSDALVDAVEIDELSALQAAANAQQSPWPERVTVVNTSFQAFARGCTNRYDVIVSNPPYFLQSLKSPDAAKNLTRHTDWLPYNELLHGVSRILSPKGRFCGVFPYTEGNIFIAQAAGFGLYCNKKLNVQPKPDRSTLRILVELSPQRQKPIVETTLSIHNSSGDFSPEYKALTRDFYLAF